VFAVIRAETQNLIQMVLLKRVPVAEPTPWRKTWRRMWRRTCHRTWRRMRRRTWRRTWPLGPGRRAPFSPRHHHCLRAAGDMLRWERNWAAQWRLARNLGRNFRECHAKRLYVHTGDRSGNLRARPVISAGCSRNHSSNPETAPPQHLSWGGEPAKSPVASRVPRDLGLPRPSRSSGQQPTGIFNRRHPSRRCRPSCRRHHRRCLRRCHCRSLHHPPRSTSRRSQCRNLRRSCRKRPGHRKCRRICRPRRLYTKQWNSLSIAAHAGRAPASASAANSTVPAPPAVSQPLPVAPPAPPPWPDLAADFTYWTSRARCALVWAPGRARGHPAARVTMTRIAHLSVYIVCRAGVGANVAHSERAAEVGRVQPCGAAGGRPEAEPRGG